MTPGQKWYSEKRKDPRWQKKRLEVMERDEWTCQQCFGSETTLNVHHRWYERGHDPWDYPDECFLTLCEDCHGNETADMPSAEHLLVVALKRRFLSGDLHSLAVGFERLKMPHAAEYTACAIADTLQNPELMEALMERYAEFCHARSRKAAA